MIFKSIEYKAAGLAAGVISSIIIGAMPAEAMSFSDGGVVKFDASVESTARVLGSNLGNPATRTITGIDFSTASGSASLSGGSIRVASATGGFASYVGALGTIQDISFIGGASGPIANFLRVSPNLVFHLSSAVASVNGSTASFSFDGTFTNALGAVLASGELGTELDLLFADAEDQASTFSLTAEAEAVPTPALLPGLIGMGVAALRKRKSMGVSDR